MKIYDMKKRGLALGLAVMMLAVPGCTKTKPADGTTADIKEIGKDITKDTTTQEPNPVSEDTGYIEIPQMTEAEFPTMDGSTATLPLGRMIYRMATGVSQGDADAAIQFTKTTNSYMRLMDGEADIIISYEAGAAAKERAEYANLDIRPIGLDALVFLCNTDNPVKSLSTKEIQDIYTGKITNWKDVGSGEFDKEIIAFQRPFNSGSQTLMQNIMMKDLTMMDAPEQYKPTAMGDLVDMVADYVNDANSLGYSVYYYAKNMYVLPGVRFMAVDGVEPTDETIRGGEYQYVNPFYVAVRKDLDKNSNAYKMFEWLTGDDGQSLVNQLGYVAMSDARKELKDEWKKNYAHCEIGDRKLIVSGNIFNGNTGIVVFDEDMKPEKTYADINVGDISVARSYKNIIVASKDEKVEKTIENTGVEEYREIKQGLFDIETGEWIVEPQYSYIKVDIEHGLDQAVFYCVNYDENGEIIQAFDYAGNQLAVEISADDLYSLNQDEYATKEIENGTSFRLGNDGRAELSYEDNKTTVILHGETLDLGNDYCMIFPYVAPVSNDYMLPRGWTWISTHAYDLDDVLVPKSQYIIDNNSDIVATWKRGECYLEMATETYYIVYEYGHYEILNYNGELVYDWHYSNYDNDIDYQYEEYR